MVSVFGHCLDDNIKSFLRKGCLLHYYYEYLMPTTKLKKGMLQIIQKIDMITLQLKKRALVKKKKKLINYKLFHLTTTSLSAFSFVLPFFLCNCVPLKSYSTPNKQTMLLVHCRWTLLLFIFGGNQAIKLIVDVVFMKYILIYHTIVTLCQMHIKFLTFFFFG